MKRLRLDAADRTAACHRGATAALLGLGAIGVITSAAAAQTFMGLGVLPGDHSHTYAEDISGDGSIIVGRGHRNDDSEAAVLWINGVGPTLLAPGLGYSHASALNVDGSVIVGYADIPGSGFRWTAEGGMQPLGSLNSAALGVNADGSVLVGKLTFFNPQEEHAFRWTIADGFTDLGVLPGGSAAWATGVSGDGGVVVGWAHAPTEPVAFRWTSAEGMVSLGTLPGGINSVGAAVSEDGSVIVGQAHTGGASTHIFRWTEATGMEDLGTLAGWPYAVAEDVSADGSVIVGYVYMPGGGNRRAVLWMRELGIVDLNTFLPSLGINLTGWVLAEGAGTSDDGLTLTGAGGRDGHIEAWVATLPACPADFNRDFLVNSQDFFDFLLAFFAGDTHADFNDDGAVDSLDFFDFLSTFLGSCV